MEFVRSFFNGVSSLLTTTVNHEHTGFALVCILFMIGSFCWYCHLWGDKNDPNSRCQSWKNMAIWMNFLAVLGAMYVIGRRKVYPELYSSVKATEFKFENPVDKLKNFMAKY